MTVRNLPGLPARRQLAVIPGLGRLSGGGFLALPFQDGFQFRYGKALRHPNPLLYGEALHHPNPLLYGEALRHQDLPL